MKTVLSAIVLTPLLVIAPAGAQEPAPQLDAAPAPWKTDATAYEVLCTHEKARAILTFSDQEGCNTAIRASVTHCDQVLAADFAKYEGAPDLDRRRPFIEGAAQGCFMAQMNGRTSGKFVQLLQLMARSRRSQ